MDKDLVSVIVPIYKVERYLVRCIDSIIDQTYRNLEIILIDDESPDACPQICDQYAIQDKRIRVVHKKNGGLSSARNAGLDIAQGKYITFVDSDDYIANDMVSLLHTELVKNKCDISVCSHEYTYEQSAIKTDSTTTEIEDPSLVLNSDSALEDALYLKHLSLHAWSKLYKKTLFRDIRFPDGRLYEDIGTTYKLISLAENISISPARKYYYLRRSDSITGSNFSIEMLDSLDFAQEILNYVITNYPKIVKSAQYYLFMATVSMLELISQQGHDATFKHAFTQCTEIINQYNSKILRDSAVGRKGKLYAFLSLININVLVAFLRLKTKLKKDYLFFRRLSS